MNTKLTTITTQYSKFSDNQVLTKGQLNQFLEYFEDQDHLSRVSLSGVGIVCGFDVSYDDSKKEIYITKGYGVTTDGDLLALVEPKNVLDGQTANQGFQLIQNAFKTYTHYRNFDDSNATYPPFFTEEDQIELLEIFPEEDIDLTNGSYTNLNTLTETVLDDKVVLLYLESYPKQGDLCTALDCDNQGIEQIARLRVILVSSDDAKSITGYDAIYNEHDWHEYYLALPEIAVQRDILTETKTSNYLNLKQNYYKLIKDNETLADVSLGLDAILQRFGKSSISSAISTLFDISPSAVPIDFQYRYDMLKDLVDTYTEIKGLLLHLNVHCCPSIGSFPKHLLLGRLKESQIHYKSLRHRFYKSPIVGHEDHSLKKVQSLLSRVTYLVNNYLEVEKGDEIKITPSNLQGILAHKAIPFYYNVSNSFLNYWSYHKFQNFIQTSNLSYHTANLSSSSAVQKPLLHVIDNYNFLRIEGIQGKSYRDALDQVLALKEEYGLSFDVKALSIDPTTQDIDLGEYRCEFEDLNVLLLAWTTEQECILASMASFFSGFSTDAVGVNVTEVNYTQVAHTSQVEITHTPEMEIEMTSSDKIKTHADFEKQRHTFQGEQFLTQNKESQVAFYEKNVINENLVTQEKTIGLYMKEAIEENKNGSVNDIKNATKTKVEAFLSSDEWLAKPDVRDFILNDAVDLLSVTYILSEKIPKSIAEIDINNIDTYELTLEEVCQLVRRLKVTYQTVDLEDTLKDILGLLINQLSFVCCSGEKLTILLDEIEKRKQEILKQLQLSEFVKKHPGLRHYAGVPIGGTFVMAYLTDNAEDKTTYQPVRLDLDFLNQPIDDTVIEIPIENTIIDKTIEDRITDKRAQIPVSNNVGIIKLWDDRISTRFIFLSQITKETQYPRNEIVMIGETLERTVSNFADFLNNIWRVAGLSNKCKATPRKNRLTIELIDQNIRKEENFIQFANPAILNTKDQIFFDENEIITRNLTTKNTVIADFALPYMCCSDCAPINFVVPKEPVSLSLPSPFICLNNNTTPIPFTVLPVDGEVKAIVEGNISGGVTQNDVGAYFFDATLLDASLLGKAIRFTVNDEETTAVITVYQNPKPTVILLIDDFIYNTARTEVEAFFEVSGTGINTNSIFAWDFGDNSTIANDRPDDNNVVSHTYTLPISPNNTVFPRLTVTNELCSEEVILEGIVFQDPIEPTLDIQDTYCFDVEGEVEPIPFTNISPLDGNIELADASINGLNIEDNHLVITSAFTDFEQEIEFTIEGQPTDAKITIFNKDELTVLNASREINYDNTLRTSATVTFMISGDIPDSATFNWEFGDGNTSTESPNNNGRLQHTYDLTDNVTSVAPTLTISHGPCEEDINIPEIIFEEAPDFTLNIKPTDCFDREISRIPFTNVNPTDGNIEVAGGDRAGLEIDNTQNRIVITSAFTDFGDEIEFTIEGQPTNAKITIFNKASLPDLTISRGIVSSNANQATVVFTIIGDIRGVDFEWDFGDGNTSNEKPDDNKNLQHTYQLPLSKNPVSPTLVISKGPCNESIPIDMITINPDTDERTCNDIVKDGIDADNILVQEDPNADGDLGSLIVEPTKNLYTDVASPDNIDSFITGQKNSELKSLFSKLIIDTTSGISIAKQETVIRLIAKYLRVQIRLFIHIIHCQEEFNEEDIRDLTLIFENIKSALEALKGKEINGLEGSLESFLTNCLENDKLAPFIKQHIMDMLEILKA